MVITTDFKRGWLGRIYRLTSPATLLGRLEAQNDARVDGVLTGRQVRATSANGHSVEFSTSGTGNNSDPTFAGMVDLCAEMLRLFVDSKAALGGSPTDALIYAEMLDRLQPCRRVSMSYVGLRLGQSPELVGTAPSVESIAGTLVQKDGKTYLNYNDGPTPLHEIVPQVNPDGSFGFGIDQQGIAE